jgi:protein tyrosine phosphatase
MGSTQSDLKKCQTERDNLRNQYNSCNSNYTRCNVNLDQTAKERNDYKNQYEIVVDYEMQDCILDKSKLLIIYGNADYIPLNIKKSIEY